MFNKDYYNRVAKHGSQGEIGVSSDDINRKVFLVEEKPVDCRQKKKASMRVSETGSDSQRWKVNMAVCVMRSTVFGMCDPILHSPQNRGQSQVFPEQNK